MDTAEPTFIHVKDEPEHEGLVALLYSFTSKTVPRLPHPLAECAGTGYRYSAWTTSPENGQLHNPAHGFCSRYLRLTRSHPPLDDIHGGNRYGYEFETRFSTSTPSVRGKDNKFWPGHVSDADDNEKQVDECAGLRIGRLKQLLDLDASLPQM